MTEVNAEAPAQEPATEAPTDEPKDWEAEATRLRDELSKARKWEERAKENSAKARELEKLQQASMSETERAVAEAESRGRTAAVQEFGKRLATSEIRAAAATAGADLDGVFDYLDLSRFVGDDGEPDAEAITAFVGGLPKKASATTSSLDLDLGVRAPGNLVDDSPRSLIAAGLEKSSKK